MPYAGPNFPDHWTPDQDTFHGSNEIWDDEPAGSSPLLGDARVLCEAFGRVEEVARVEAVLRESVEDRDRVRLSSDYHLRLAELLNWPKEITDSYNGIAERRASADEESAGWMPTGDAR